MGRKTLKPAPAAPEIDDDFDADDLSDSPRFDGDDDTDDLWDIDDEDDAPVPGSVDEDDDFDDVQEDDSESAAAPASVSDEFTAFSVAMLPPKMRLKPLAAQSNDWILATIARLVDEIPTHPKEADALPFERDLLALADAAGVRGITDDLSEDTRAFIDEGRTIVAARATQASDDAGPSADHEKAAASLEIQYVRREHVHPDPLQPRLHADAELRDSIRSLGILQPITVRPVRGSDLIDRAEPCAHCSRPWAMIAAAKEFVIVDGERRWQGSEGVLETVPVIERADVGDEYERLKTQIVANSGKPLTPIEEARTFARMLESRDVGVAALARDIGKPASTVHDRVKLLELGPWMPWIENGAVSISMAVEHLVPLRGIPDEFHAEAIAKLTDGAEAPTVGAPFADSVDEFGHDVASAYDKFMYPLGKTKNDYEKQPRFNTKNHDAECTCGGITWGGSWQGVVAKGRKYCGNPDWWKPLDAAAKRDERAKAKESGETTSKSQPGKPRLELPAGTKTVDAGYSSAPKGVIVLTDSEGRWRVCDSHWNLDGAFDPADLAIDDTKLVRVKQSYGLDRVGTKDTAAVEAARAKWATRFAPARAAAGSKLVAIFDKLEKTYALAGGGVHQLLRSWDIADAELGEIAQLLGVDVPKGFGARRNERHTKGRDEWTTKTLKRGDAERIATFLVFLAGDAKRQLPSAVIETEQRDTVEAIGKKRAPWITTKAAKPDPKTSSKSAKKNRGGGGR